MPNTEPIYVFDSHRFVKQLAEAGMPERQAEILAEERKNLIENQLATKLDLAKIEHDIAEIKRDINRLNKEFKHDMAEMKSELKRDMAEIDSNLRRDMTEMKAELKRGSI